MPPLDDVVEQPSQESKILEEHERKIEELRKLTSLKLKEANLSVSSNEEIKGLQAELEVYRKEREEIMSLEEEYHLKVDETRKKFGEL